MTTTVILPQTCTVDHDGPPCGAPAVRYLLIAYPADAPTTDARLRGEVVCDRHAREAKVFARPPYARIVVELPMRRRLNLGRR